MNSQTSMRVFFKQYSKKEIALSLLTGFIFLLLPLLIIVPIYVNTILLMVHYVNISIPIFLFILIVVNWFQSRFFIEALQSYRIITDYDYRPIRWIEFVVSSLLIIMIFYVILFIVL